MQPDEVHNLGYRSVRLEGLTETAVRQCRRSVLPCSLFISTSVWYRKIIDRASAAVKPHYETIRDIARNRDVDYPNETNRKKDLQVAGYDQLDDRLFHDLSAIGKGILISDGYRIYQAFLAHLIRRDFAEYGKWVAAELRRL